MASAQHNGELYLPTDPEILKEQNYYLNLLYDFNQLRPSDSDQRQRLMEQLFGDLGEGCYIESPFHANWGAIMFILAIIFMLTLILRRWMILIFTLVTIL